MRKKSFFASVPKPTTQMGLFSVKNASSKFSSLGTFKQLIMKSVHILQLDSAGTDPLPGREY
jgi:hypothetical protein